MRSITAFVLEATIYMLMIICLLGCGGLTTSADAPPIVAAPTAAVPSSTTPPAPMPTVPELEPTPPPPEPAPEPTPTPTPEPDPEPPPVPTAACPDPELVALEGCYATDAGTLIANVSVTVAGEGTYRAFLMTRKLPFTHEIKSEAKWTATCSESATVETVHIENGSQLAYVELQECADPKAAAVVDTFRLAGRLLWITSVSDLVSTELGLARGRHEANPLMRRRAIRIPAKIGVTYLINRMTSRRPNRKGATILRWVSAGLFAFATGNNIVVSF